jgi:type I restriction enzyme S subunit
MSEWKEMTLGEACNFQEGYVNPSQNEPSYFGEDIKWLRANDLNESYVYDTSRKLSKKGFESAGKAAKLFKPNTIAISKSGSIGKLGFLKDYMCGNRAVINIEPKPSIDVKFLFSLLKANQAYFPDLAVGSVQPNLYVSSLASLEIIVPPLPEQKSIASILSSLDDKIDLLNRQNATLEKMAETLFRQWFVEEAKEEWEEKIITELFEVRDGTHDSPKQKEYGNKLITSKHLNNNSIDFSTAYYISKEDYSEINKRSRVETNDILFSMIGTIGLIYFEQSKDINYAIKNIGLFKTSQNPDWSYFTLLWLKSNYGKEFIHENKSGSTQEYIALGSLRSIVFNIPPQEIIQEFNSIVKPYFDKIKTNQNQICTLTSLRDTLLPKLMSGEVRVEN